MKTNTLYIFFPLFFAIFTSAQIKKDAVLFTVENTPVLASEFLRVYNKNLDLVKGESQKDVDEYLKLFINYKLKLIEARALEFDNNPRYIRGEFENYKKQLAKNYLTDHKVTDKLVKEAYQRISYDVKVSHILIKIAEHDRDSAAVYAEILKFGERLLNENFESLQKEVHDGVTIFAEDLGCFSGFKMLYAFENVAFNTAVGEVSQPFRTSYGYHVLKYSTSESPEEKSNVGHIMVPNNQKDTLIKPETRIQEINKLIQQGENFESLAKQFSDDKSSAKNGGKLSPFKSGQLRSVEFEDMAFGLKNSNDIKVREKLLNGNDLETIKEQVNVNDSQNVIFTTAIMTAEHQDLPENFEFIESVSDVCFFNDAFHVINVKSTLPETEKNFGETKSKVISDYQDEVERLWAQS